MKNAKSVLAIIAIVAMIGFGFVACGDDGGDFKINSTNGKLTITDFDEYEGKWVIATYYGYAFHLYAAKDLNSNGKITGGKIVNGSVELKVWMQDEPYVADNFSGSSSYNMTISIYDTGSAMFTDEEEEIAYKSKEVSFTNGVGTVQWGYKVENTSGNLTITGFDEFDIDNYYLYLDVDSFEGKWVIAYGNGYDSNYESFTIYAGADLKNSGKIAGGKIENGSVDLKVWYQDDPNKIGNFTESESYYLTIRIYDTNDAISMDDYYSNEYFVANFYGAVDFTNGTGTIDINDLYY